MQAALAAYARESRASERRPQVAQEPAIHPRDPDVHLLRDAVTPLQIRGPNRGRKAVLRVIRHAHCFFFRIERSDMANWPEDFFFHASRRFGQSSLDGGLHIEAAVKGILEMRDAASGNDVRTLVLSQTIIRENLFTMLR